MNWLYFIWSFGFTSGRIYGNKGAGYQDEKPLLLADLHRFLNIMNEHKGNGINLVLRKYTEKVIKDLETP